jgi:hypothetical protein
VFFKVSGLRTHVCNYVMTVQVCHDRAYACIQVCNDRVQKNTFAMGIYPFTVCMFAGVYLRTYVL